MSACVWQAVRASLSALKTLAMKVSVKVNKERRIGDQSVYVHMVHGGYA